MSKSVEEKAEAQAEGARSAIEYMNKYENYVEGFQQGHAECAREKDAAIAGLKKCLFQMQNAAIDLQSQLVEARLKIEELSKK